MMYMPSELARHVAQMQAQIEADVQAVVDVILLAMIKTPFDMPGELPDLLPRDPELVAQINAWEPPDASDQLTPQQARALIALETGNYLMNRWIVDSDHKPISLPPVRKDVRRKFIAKAWINPITHAGVPVFAIADAGRVALARHRMRLVQLGR